MWFPLIRLLIERCPVRTNEAEQGYFESEQENGLEILYCALITLDCCQFKPRNLHTIHQSHKHDLHPLTKMQVNSPVNLLTCSGENTVGALPVFCILYLLLDWYLPGTNCLGSTAHLVCCRFACSSNNTQLLLFFFKEENYLAAK